MSPVTHERSWSSTYSNMHRVLRRTQFCTSIIAVKGQKELYDCYKKEVGDGKHLKFSYFTKVWTKLLRTGVTDPETSVQYSVRVRQSRAKGFKKCNTCEYLKNRIAGTANSAKRAALVRKFKNIYRKSQTTGRMYPVVSNDCTLLDKVYRLLLRRRGRC